MLWVNVDFIWVVTGAMQNPLLAVLHCASLVQGPFTLTGDPAAHVPVLQSLETEQKTPSLSAGAVHVPMLH